MIIRRNFFKKVLIGSIFVFQLTVTSPVYNTLAVGPEADKTPAKNSIPSDLNVAKENEEAYNSKDTLEKHYSSLLKKYYNKVDDKEQEIKSNTKELERINLALTCDKITEEEKQLLQEELNIIKELNKELIDAITEISEKIEKVVTEKREMSEEAEKSKKAEEIRKVEEAEKAKNTEKIRKAEELRKAEDTKKAKEDLEKYYSTLIEKYFQDIIDKELEFKINIEKVKKINLDIKSGNITEEEKQALKEQLNNIKEHNKRLDNAITNISDEIDKVMSKKLKITEEGRKAEKVRNTAEAKKVEETKEFEKGYRTKKDTHGKEWRLYSYKNEHDLTIKILTDEDFIRNWASIADRLGFGWCGGTKSPWVGDDFSIQKTGDNEYTLSANYNKSDPFSDGPAADQRLKIKVSNIRFFIDGSSLEYGEKKILSVRPITIASGTFRNGDDEKTLTEDFGFEYSKTTSITREDRFDFSQEIGTETSFTVGVPKISANESTINVKVGFGQWWSDTKYNSTTKTYTKKITLKISPKHKRRVELVAAEQQAEVPYKANIYISYNVSLEGFLRLKGNAHVDHPTNRPYIMVNFPDNSEGQNAVDFIKDIYANKHIPDYSQWDFNWVDQQYKTYSILNNINALSQYKFGGVIEGVFRYIDGTEEELLVKDQVPLSTSDAKEEGNLQDSVIFKKISPL